VMVGKQGPNWGSRGWRISYRDRAEAVEFHFADGKKFDEVKTPLTDTAWHHVAAVRQGKRAILYVDGQEKARKTADVFGTDVNCDEPLCLGHVGGWGKFAGKLDEVRLYSRALPPAEIAARHKALKDKMKLAAPGDKAGAEAEDEDM